MNFLLTSQFLMSSKKIVVLDKRNRKRGKRIQPGKQVGANDFLSEDEGNEKPTSSKRKARNERKVSRKVDEDENDDVCICNECKEE